MSKASPIALAAVVLASCVSPSSSIEREIRAQYDRIERAYAAQDLDAVMASRHADVETVVPMSEGEIEGYDQQLRLMQRWFNENKPPIDVRYSIESIDVRSADEVAVRVLQRGSRYREMDGQRRHVRHEVRQRETWIRTPAGWKVRRIDDIDLLNRRVWIDGRSIPLAEQ
jgi:ketosteroid isomerase-like protein